MVSSLDCCRFVVLIWNGVPGAARAMNQAEIPPPQAGEGERVSIQREDEQVARVLEVVVFHRMQVASARLHGEILLRPDSKYDRRALERRADIEAPQLLQPLVVISDHPAVLKR